MEEKNAKNRDCPITISNLTNLRSNCSGSNCMMWVWDEYVNTTKDVVNVSGHCGLLYYLPHRNWQEI